jgi:hypothetical protein
MLGADNDDGEYDKEDEYFSAILLGAYTFATAQVSDLPRLISNTSPT